MAQSRLQRWVEKGWYSSRPLILLLPLQPVYVFAGYLRRWFYKHQWLKSWRAPVPVLVVGNLSVGGTGKTPLTIALVNTAQEKGLRVGVVSRGYGRASTDTKIVSKASAPAEVGDEPLLIYQRTGAAIAVASKRSDAAKTLLANTDLDLLITDDGLQHYALERDAECVVVDSLRGFGNGWQLPCGPLREPITRLQAATALVVNQRGGSFNPRDAGVKTAVASMTLVGAKLVNLLNGETRPLNSFNGQAVSAIAGIGNPPAFYQTLNDAGMRVSALPFADHHDYSEADLPDVGNIVMMTEKDAVKISGFCHSDCWYLPVSAELPEGFAENLIAQAQQAYKARL